MDPVQNALADSDCELIEFPGYVQRTRRKKFFVPRGDIMGAHIRTARQWEFTCQITLYNRYARGGSYVEVGANIGTDTVHASDFFKNCYVFEPSRRNGELLVKNLEVNGISNVRVHRAAVGERDGRGTLYLGEKDNLGAANLKPEDPQSRGTEEVEIVTLDSAIPKEVRDITYVHIDAEGHDIQVLKGGVEFLARQEQRPLIRMEFQPRSLQLHGSEISELIAIMERFGYAPKFVAASHLVSLSKSILSEMFMLWQPTEGWIDILLCP
jgi:FkbM family methyltransferase